MLDHNHESQRRARCTLSGLKRERVARTLLVAGLLLTAGTFSADRAQGQTSDAGNGGDAMSGANGTVTFGDIETGENTGNIVYAGDIINSEAHLEGGDVSYPTILYVTVPVGPPIADASGGNDALAGGPPGPTNLTVRGDRNRNDVDVRTDDENTNTNTNSNSNSSEGGDGGSGGNVVINPTPVP
jgi:hypothetical protein